MGTRLNEETSAEVLSWGDVMLSPSQSGSKNLSEKGSDPLEAIRFHWFFLLAGEGQTPFQTGSK